MSSLDALNDAGATFKRSVTSSTSSFAINGIPIQSSSKEGVSYKWTLPEDSGIRAIFTPESFGKTLVKIFKKELQVGDPTFDDAVYIDTDNKEACASFLEDEEIRNIVFGVIVDDGRIAINGKEVVYDLVGEDGEGEKQAMATLIGKLMG